MRQSRLLVLSVLFLVAAPTLLAQQSTHISSPSAEPSVSQARLSPDVSAQMSAADISLTNPRADVMAAYGRISQAAGLERKSLYADMPESMQSDLWLLHLQYFLEDHEELLPGQQAVIREAMQFVANGGLKMRMDNPEWFPVRAHFKQLDLRLKAVLGNQLASEATAHLSLIHI